jgi:hypothetical protein
MDLGQRAIATTIGGAAIILGTVAAVWLMAFAARMSGSIGEGVRLVLIALAVAMLLAGLPLASAALSRQYREQADLAMTVWRWLLAGAAIAVIGLTMANPQGVQPANQGRPRPIPDIVWQYSNGCAEPENAYQARICADYRSETVASIGEGSSPLERLVVVLFGIGAAAGAGIMGRFAILAMGEAGQSGTGQGGHAFDLPPPPDMAIGHATDVPLTPLQIFDMWFNGRIRIDPSGKLPATLAYEDYRAACLMNGYSAMSQTAFGERLGSKASNSGGRIAKQKSNGTMVYNGLAIVGDRMAMDIHAVDFGPVPQRT